MLLVSAFAPLAAAAQDTPVDQSTQLSSAPLQAVKVKLDESRNLLANIKTNVDAATKDQDDDRLLELKTRTDEVTRTVTATIAGPRARLDEIKARLTALGDAPAKDAAPEASVVTDERNRLVAERNEITALISDADGLSADSSQLAGAITATRRTIFTQTIFNRTAINGDLFVEARAAGIAEGENFRNTVGSWASFVWKFKRLSLFAAVFMSLCAALVLVAGGYRIFAPLLKEDEAQAEPDYITRLSVAFWSTTIPTTAAAAFCVATYFFLENFNVLTGNRIPPMLWLTMSVCVAVYFVSKLTHAVLAPKNSALRLVNVSDRGARFLTSAIIAMAIVNGLDYLLGGFSEVLGSPLVLTVVKSFFASIIVGLILIIISWIRPMRRQGEPVDAPGRRWPRFVSIVLMGTGIALISASVLGYVGLSRFLANQIVITSAILVTMYIGLLSGKAVAKQNAFADTKVGRGLQRRYKLGQVQMDQAGLVSGLSIYVLVMLAGIPLILLQWGFQFADIRAWGLQLLTEIKVGSISISLIGIIVGILLFTLGYFVTGWFQKWLDGTVMARSQVDIGVRNSVKTGIGYLGVGIAGLVGISAAGINLSSLALVAGALSLGIGFGLQNIVSNFVSGLILLAERPFKVGDWVVSGTMEGIVKRISVRATEIETFQQQSIIVPNSVFINGSVGNWTHRNKMGRSDIAISVTYNSDPQHVMKILLDIAQGNPMVLKNPEPMVAFLGFGDSTLNFELRVYLPDILKGMRVRNDLRVAIFKRFVDEKIQPFYEHDNPLLESEDEVVAEGGDPAPVSSEDERLSPAAKAQIDQAAGRARANTAPAAPEKTKA